MNFQVEEAADDIFLPPPAPKSTIDNRQSTTPPPELSTLNSQPSTPASSRSVWKGAISFGIVTIPITLKTAVAEQDIHFNMIHTACKGRLKLPKFCPQCEREVAKEEILKGYQCAKGEYVLLTEQELESIPRPSAQTIEIDSFSPAHEVDPIYFLKTYYLEADGPAADKSYALLLLSMQKTKHVALARIAIRGRERPCCIRSNGPNLVLSTMHWFDEVRRGPALTDRLPSEAELNLAGQLIEAYSGEFDPSSYRDNYRDHVETMIQAKLEGRVITAPAAPAAPAESLDLAAALKASFEAAKARKAA